MHVGERIQLKMKEQKISQNRLAKAAQISQSGLSSIISGAVSPKEVTISAIANALGCSVSELMGENAAEQKEKIPRTPEARIVSGGMDKLPQEQREQILNVLRAMFANSPDLFKKGDDDGT